MIVWRTWLVVLFAAALGGCDRVDPPDTLKGKPPEGTEKTGWVELLDGKTLAGWKVPEYGGSGKVYVKDGAVHLEFGNTCTGITYAGQVPREDYEIELEAMRVDGGDFFCGLTFPVGKKEITLVLGGWGGTVVGLSCLDHKDASANETSRDIVFTMKRWYRVRVRVTGTHVQCWLDGKPIAHVARQGRIITLRPEVELSVPLGVTTWQPHGAVRGIRLRKLPPGE